jgi:type III secretory pathway component EscV
MSDSIYFNEQTLHFTKKERQQQDKKKKNRQHHDQKKKDKQHHDQKKKDKQRSTTLPMTVR